MKWSILFLHSDLIETFRNFREKKDLLQFFKPSLRDISASTGSTCAGRSSSFLRYRTSQANPEKRKRRKRVCVREGGGAHTARRRTRYAPTELRKKQGRNQRTVERTFFFERGKMRGNCMKNKENHTPVVQSNPSPTLTPSPTHRREARVILPRLPRSPVVRILSLFLPATRTPAYLETDWTRVREKEPV